MGQRKTLEQFITESYNIHGEKYSYSKSLYVNSKTKVIITCPIHGDFNQTPMTHIKGTGCSKCRSTKMTLTFKVFRQKASITHNHKYTYYHYINSSEKIKIHCPIHGVFTQRAGAHLRGAGCYECSGVKPLTTKIFIEKALLISDRYLYSKCKYIDTYTQVCIICPIHGEFWQSPNSHLSGCGCPKCSKSKGEIKVANTLDRLNIKYEEEYKFKDCKNINKLPFDFYLPEHHTCIEYDGMQHQKPITFFGGNKTFEKIKSNDLIKTNYCKQNNIKLIRYNIDNIDSIINIKEYNEL